MEYFAGVDVGGTNLRAVVGTDDASSLEASVLGEASLATPPGPDGEAVTAAILDVTAAACAEAGIDPSQVTAGGVGSIGPLDLAAGAIVDPANLSAGVDRVELRKPLCHLLDTDDVSILNDTSAGALGEHAATLAAPDDLVYLTMSTGIGAGACVDGHVLSGANGNAGEMGHATVDPTGAMDCACGAPGHWEAYCSGRNLPAYTRHLHETGVGRLDAGAGTTLDLADPSFSARDLFAAAPEDAFAAAVLDRVGTWNAIGVAILTHAFAPSKVVVGGAVALNNSEAVLAPIREQLPAHLCIPTPEVSLTTLGDNVVLYGALARAMRPVAEW